MILTQALLAASLASSTQAFDLLPFLKRQSSDQVTCNGAIQAYQGGSYCCPGVILSNSSTSSSDAYCCVGGHFAHIPVPLASTAGGGRFSDCFPNCAGSASGTASSTGTGSGADWTTFLSQDPAGVLPGTATAIATANVCQTSIALTDPAYSSLVNAAGSSLGVTSQTTGTTAPATNLAGTTTTSAASSTGSSVTATAGGSTTLSGTRTSGTGTTNLPSSTRSVASQSVGTTSGSGNGAARRTGAPVAVAFIGGLAAAVL